MSGYHCAKKGPSRGIKLKFDKRKRILGLASFRSKRSKLFMAEALRDYVAMKMLVCVSRG